MIPGTTVTTTAGRFAGRSGTVVDFGGMPNEVWVVWIEGAFKTLDIATIDSLTIVGA